MNSLRLGLWYQCVVFRSRPTDVSILIAIPFTTAILLSVVKYADRTDLAGAAVLAPALSSLLSVALSLGGDSITGDRHYGTLDLLLAAPVSFVGYLWGRVSATVVVGLLGFVEAWLIGVGAFGARPVLTHPGWFAACLVATALATVPTAGLIAGLLALGRNGAATQNYLNYPLYVLAGIFTPAALLPGWLHPVSAALYLSWSADLARSCLSTAPLIAPLHRLLVIVGLGVLTFAISAVLLHHIARQLRRTGRAAL